MSYEPSIDDDALTFAVGAVVRRKNLTATQKKGLLQTAEALSVYNGLHRQLMCEVTTALSTGYVLPKNRKLIRECLDKMDGLGELEKFILEAPRMSICNEWPKLAQGLIDRLKGLEAEMVALQVAWETK